MPCLKGFLKNGFYIGIAVAFLIGGYILGNSAFEDKSIENKLEAEIHELITKEKHTPAEVVTIIESFKDLDPKSYNGIEGANFYEVVDWLYHVETAIKMEHIDDIFSLHNHVDGAATEGYSAIMYELFEESPFFYVQSLSKLNTKEIESISIPLC